MQHSHLRRCSGFRLRRADRARRPQAAALVAALADPGRGWDAIVIGEYERAFYGSQYASMAALFEHYGASCGCPKQAAGLAITRRMTSRR